MHLPFRRPINRALSIAPIRSYWMGFTSTRQERARFQYHNQDFCWLLVAMVIRKHHQGDENAVAS